MAGPLAPWKGLYYPYLEISNTDWLKAAALYYDYLERIVPPGAETHDNRSIRQLNDHFEFVRNVNPGKAAQDIIPDFLRFAIQHLKQEKDRNELLEKLEHTFSFDNKFAIHTGKVGNELITQLDRLGFGVTHDPRSSMYRFDQVTGSLYLAFLANYLAARNQSSVVTDDLRYQPLLRHIQAPAANDRAFELATFVISCSVPEPLEEIPLRKIIAFRKRHDTERSRFYTEVNRLVSDLASVPDGEALQEIFQQRYKLIRAAAGELRKSFLGVGINTSSGLLSVSAPAALAQMGAAAATGGLFVVAGAKTYSAYQDTQKAKAGSPASYVLSLRRLRSSTLLEDLFKGKIII